MTTDRIEQVASAHQWRGGYFCTCGQELNSPLGFSRHILDAFAASTTEGA